jgi:serine/threonine-protein kinase
VAIPWAEVFVDGDRVGLTPFPAIPLAPGPHVVELRHPDFRPYLRTIELKAGERFGLTVNLRLEAIRR